MKCNESKKGMKLIRIFKAILIIQIVLSFACNFYVFADEETTKEDIVINSLEKYDNTNDIFPNEDEDDYEKYSEEYKKYLKLSDEEKAKVSVIPEKYDITIKQFEEKYGKEDEKIYIDETTLKAASKNTLLRTAVDMANIDAESTIPTSYDMRNDITINVEKQYQDTCWIFASLGTVRTYLAKQGYNGGVTPNLSERHLDYLTSKYYEKGNNREPGSGGNFSKALKYFKYNDGPILESRFANSTTIDVTSSSELQRIDNFTPNYYVHEIISFPSITKVRQSDGSIKIYNGSDEIAESSLTTIRNRIKKQIKNNGGVHCSVRTNDNFKYTNSNGKEYWYDDGTLDEADNHGMVIIGWNDNYSRENFKTKNSSGATVMPKHNGAYLVLNSWGSTWNGDGYLWISYDDYGIERGLNGIVSADATEKYCTYTFQNDTAYSKMKAIFANKIGDVTVNDNSKTIKVLDLVFNEITYISSLEIKNAGLTDSDLRTIFRYQLPWVRNLNLSGNSITDVSLIDCSDIEFLCLNNNNIEDINELYQYKGELKELYLNDNQISDCGVLSQLTGLNKLYLNNNKIEEVTPLTFLSLDEFYIRNQSISKTLNNTLDCTYPTIIKKAKLSNSNMYSSSGLEFVNCSENSGGSGITVAQGGASSVYVKVKSGIASGTTINFTVKDTLPPNLSVSSPPSNWVKNATLTINASDSVTGIKVVTVNGKSITLTNGVGKYPVTQNGKYTIVAYDYKNNTKTQVVDIDKIDSNPPTLSVTKNTNDWAKEMLLTIRAVDNESGLDNVKVNGSKITLANGQGTYKITQNGTYEIVAADIAGNNSTKQTVNVNKIDKEAPTLQVTKNTNNWAKEITLTIKATDNGSGLNNVKVNGTKITLTNGEATYKVTQNGTYEIVATDDLENSSKQTVTINKIIDNESGDINKDNKINIADVIAIIRHIGAKEGSKYYLDEEKRFIADINKDGKINIADVIGIIRLISITR